MPITKVNVNGEDIYLCRKEAFGWKVVYPIKIDGKIIWKHLIAGRSWWNLVFVGIVVAIILGAVWEHTNAVSVGNACLEREHNRTNLGNSVVTNNEYRFIVPQSSQPSKKEIRIPEIPS